MVTPIFTVQFDFVTATFIITDTTNWSGQTPPIATSCVTENFKITAPDGTLIWWNQDYSNINCDIDIDSSTIIQTTIGIPKNANGTFVTGLYTFVATVFDNCANEYYTATQTFNLTLALPTIVINQIVDCLSPLFTSQDATNYVVNGVTPTIVRTHVVSFPYNASGSPISPALTSSAANIQTGNFYSGSITTSIGSILTYVFPDGTIVTGRISGTKTITVDCSFICSLSCCLEALETQMENNRCTNEVEFNRLSALFNQVMAKVQLALVAISCGKQNKVNSLIAKIRKLTGCEEDCGCSDGLPKKVTGLAGVNTISIVTSCNASLITVTPTTIGNTTTYEICLPTAVANKINGSYNTVVVNDTPNVTVSDSGIVAGVRTFGIGVTTAPAQKTWMAFRTQITYKVATPESPIVSVTDVVLSQTTTNFITPTIILATPLAQKNNYFKVSGFQTAPNNTYKVIGEMVQLRSNAEVGAESDIIQPDMQYLQTKKVLMEVLNEKSGEFYFRFVDMNGNTLTNNMMTNYYNILINFAIYE